MQTLICPHWAPCHAGQEDDRFMRELKPRVIKLFFSGDSIPRLDVALEAATELVVLRHHGISENGDCRGIRDRAHALEMARIHADAWMKLIPVWAQRSKLAVEGLNEPRVWDWGNESPENVSAYYAELMRQLAKQSIRVVAGNLSVGWPANGEPQMPPDSPPIWKPFEEMFDAIRESGGFYGHHDYWYVNGPRTKWTTWDAQGKQVERGGWGWWAGRSLTCPWNDIQIIITEAGIDSHVVDPAHYFGWHGLPANRDETYWTHLREYEQQCLLDGRVIAITPFTHDFYNNEWATFSTRCEPFQSMWLAHARELEAHGAQVAARWPFPDWASTPWTPYEPMPEPAPTPAPEPPTTGQWASVVAQWDTIVTEHAAMYGLAREVVHTIIVLESAGYPGAVNDESGCVGLMQIMPMDGRPTAEQLTDPEVNIEWGCRILADYLAQYGSLEAALCAYSGVKEPTNLLREKAQEYLRTFERRWGEVWPGLALPITVPVARTVDQARLVAARWYAEEAVRRIEQGKAFDGREILLRSVVSELYAMAGDR